LRRFGAWAAVALLALAPARAEHPAASPAKLLIGLAGPFSGPYAADGEEMRRAAEAAVAAIDGAGGLLGTRLVLEVVDDGCERTRAQAAAERLAALAPALVVGHSCASAALAAAPVYAQAGLVMITPGARHPDITARRAGPSIFRLAGREDAQGAAAAAHLRAHAKSGRLAIVHDRTAVARRLAEATSSALAEAGAPPPLVLTIVAGEKDYGALAARLAQSRVEAVLFAGFPIEAGIVLRQLRAAGSAAMFLAPDFAATAELVSAAGSAAEGLNVLLPFEPRRAERTWPSAAAIEAVSSRDAPARGLWLRTFAAVEAWAEAVRRAVSGKPEAVAGLLGRETLPTALGAVSFDARGDVRLPSYEPWVWKEGGWARAR
jgi:branched-chain amino acid transport system substrate-binding protein